MANWTHSVTAVRRDPSSFNLLADFVYADDSVPPQVFTERGVTLGFPRADQIIAFIDEIARRRIKNVFEPGDLALAEAQAIANGKPRALPPDPSADPIAVFNAAFTKLAQLKQQESLGMDVSADLAVAVAAANDAKAALP